MRSTIKEFKVSSDYQRYLLKVLVEIQQWEEGNTDKPVKSSGEDSSGTLPLKKFNGDPLFFQSFWDSFESAVDKNRLPDDITKFNYLKGLLEDKASLVLQRLTLISDNYRSAIALLRGRFGDPQVITTVHMDALLAISHLTSDKVSDFRTICDIIEHAKSPVIPNLGKQLRTRINFNNYVQTSSSKFPGKCPKENGKLIN